MKTAMLWTAIAIIALPFGFIGCMRGAAAMANDSLDDICARGERDVICVINNSLAPAFDAATGVVRAYTSWLYELRPSRLVGFAFLAGAGLWLALKRADGRRWFAKWVAWLGWGAIASPIIWAGQSAYSDGLYPAMYYTSGIGEDGWTSLLGIVIMIGFASAAIGGAIGRRVFKQIPYDSERRRLMQAPFGARRRRG